MNTTSRSEIRRILLALEPSGVPQAVLELAAELARTHNAELAGFLIEDMNLLRAAELPFVSEITWSGAEERRLDPELLLRRLHAEAERFKQALARQAETVKVRWSFQSVEVQALRATLTAITREELVILGRLSRTPWARTFHPPRILLLHSGGESYRELEQLAQTLLESLRDTEFRIAPHAVWEGIPLSQPAQIFSTLKNWRPSLVVALAGPWLDDAGLLQALLDQIECPLVIVR